ALIPHAAISGLLLLVAWTLLDIPRWRHLLRTQRGECAIAAATLAATIAIRIAGRDVRCRYTMSDSTVPSRIATSMR
ncbi:hypothetical protein LLE87_39800, partial [Paenibacillus polymyxa]|nr:hypothetical protein [Paenibacillus polymyxa]